MYKPKLLFALLLLCSGLYIACNKDNLNSSGPQATVTFAGRILDENGQAIQGAQVRVEGESASTDKNGVFRLKPVRVDADNAIVFVNKIGYFDFSRAHIVQNNAILNLTIQLLKKQQAGTINASAGGNINLVNGARLSFPANAIADKTGSAYTGTVRVYARYLDPSDPELAYKMPGDLRGINAEGAAQILSTFGMMAVELESQSGQALKIAAGNSVEIRMPIAADHVAQAPEQIPLWHYDNDTARWIEEGSAQKIGNEYVGTVQHFSFWNCDYPYELINLTGKVFLSNNQLPLVGASIRLTISGIGSGYGNTDGNGCFSGAVPKNEVMLLEVFMYGQCGNKLLFSQQIGPFSDNTTLASIIISNGTFQTISIKGRALDCGNQALEDGYVKIVFQQQTYIRFTDVNGNFELNIPTCDNNASSCDIIVYDPTNLLESQAQTFNIQNNNLDAGDIQVCNGLSEFIQYTLDGQFFTKVDPGCGIESDSMPNGGFYTQISALEPTSFGTFISFNSNNQPGTFAIDGMRIDTFEIDFANSNLSTKVTTAPAVVGDPIIGTFGTSFKDIYGNAHTISGSYRVIRDY